MSEKSFLMILGPIWSKIVFWKKKFPKTTNSAVGATVIFYAPCCVKTGENDRFQHKKYIKTQNFKSSKMDKKNSI